MNTTTPTHPPTPLLIVDDEERFLRTVRLVLASAGINNVETTSDSRTVAGLLREKAYGVAVLDITMPHTTGIELLKLISSEHPHIRTVMITGISEVATAVECMKLGAFDYVVKPVNQEGLVACVRRALAQRAMDQENAALKHRLLHDVLEHPEAFADIVTNNSSMHHIFQYVEAIAPTDLPILIVGETGTGKELMARAIHRLSGRTGAFVAVNAAGLDDAMFSDTLFGHQRGAFTGADRDRRGLIEEAASGTLFLDEIGELRPESQVKLLRLLQEGHYYPLGQDAVKRSDARIVAATNAAPQGNPGFRRDLYYRLQAHQIALPPLRERREDIPLLVRTFLAQAAPRLGKELHTPPQSLFSTLAAGVYPGNIRELQGLVFDAASRCRQGEWPIEYLRTRLSLRRDAESPVSTQAGLTFPASLPTLEEATNALVKEALRRTSGNKTVAAQMIGVTRQTLGNRLKERPPGARVDCATPANP
jgi:DNA-binding NtrC family response regulator